MTFTPDMVKTLENEVSTRLGERRFLHTKGVAVCASKLAELCKTVISLGAPPLFTEPQYEDMAAQTIARETGAPLCTLDPIVTGPATDIPLTLYEDVMRENLTVLLAVLGE